MSDPLWLLNGNRSPYHRSIHREGVTPMARQPPYRAWRLAAYPEMTEEPDDDTDA
jgi:hypothetical protein